MSHSNRHQRDDITFYKHWRFFLSKINVPDAARFASFLMYWVLSWLLMFKENWPFSVNTELQVKDPI